MIEPLPAGCSAGFTDASARLTLVSGTNVIIPADPDRLVFLLAVITSSAVCSIGVGGLGATSFVVPWQQGTYFELTKAKHGSLVTKAIYLSTIAPNLDVSYAIVRST